VEIGEFFDASEENRRVRIGPSGDALKLLRIIMKHTAYKKNGADGCLAGHGPDKMWYGEIHSDFDWKGKKSIN